MSVLALAGGGVTRAEAGVGDEPVIAIRRAEPAPMAGAADRILADSDLFEVPAFERADTGPGAASEELGRAAASEPVSAAAGAAVDAIAVPIPTASAATPNRPM